MVRVISTSSLEDFHESGVDGPSYENTPEREAYEESRKARRRRKLISSVKTVAVTSGRSMMGGNGDAQTS